MFHGKVLEYQRLIWANVHLQSRHLSTATVFFDSPNNCCHFLRIQIHPPETKRKDGKPGDQNVCLQCGHWSVAQRVDVYAGNRFLYPLEIKRGNRKSPTNGYKWWIGGLSISYWTMISTDHEISIAWKQCLIGVDGLICFEVANLIWKTHSPNIRKSRRRVLAGNVHVFFAIDIISSST